MGETRQSSLRGYKFLVYQFKNALAKRTRIYQKKHDLVLIQETLELTTSISSKLLPIAFGAIILER